MRSARDKRAASKRKAGTLDPVLGAAALAAGPPSGGGGALAAPAGARLAPQLGQKVAESAASF
jgi:hypothetical protein